MRDSLNRINVQPLAPGFAIDVRVILHEDSKNANLPASLTLQVESAGSILRNTVRVGAAGRFAVRLQPGESRLSISGLPQGYSVRSMTSGTTDLLSGPVLVQPGMSEVVIVVSFEQRI
jgi:hypothetical protein